MTRFPHAVVLRPDDRLQQAIFSAHMAEDELEHQRERYDSAVQQHNTLADLRATAAALEERRRLLYDGGREIDLFEQLKGDPVTRKAIVPEHILREDRRQMRERARERG